MKSTQGDNAGRWLTAVSPGCAQHAWPGSQELRLREAATQGPDDTPQRLVEKEPVMQHWPREARIPDGHVLTGADEVYWDVSVVHPCAASYVRLAAQKHLAAAFARENAKRKDYEGPAQKDGAVFVPFVIETFGAFGFAAKDLLKKVRAFATKSGSFVGNVDELKAATITRIAIALQRHNARTLEQGYHLARAAARGM